MVNAFSLPAQNFDLNYFVRLPRTRNGPISAEFLDTVVSQVCRRRSKIPTLELSFRMNTSVNALEIPHPCLRWLEIHSQNRSWTYNLRAHCLAWAPLWPMRMIAAHRLVLWLLHLVHCPSLRTRPITEIPTEAVQSLEGVWEQILRIWLVSRNPVDVSSTANILAIGISATPKKPGFLNNALLPSPIIPTPHFYDKNDAHKGSPEVRVYQIYTCLHE